MPYRTRSLDPYKLTVKYAGTCVCGEPIKKGDSAFYYPHGKLLYGFSCGCGEAAQREFNSAKSDEDFYNGR